MKYKITSVYKNYLKMLLQPNKRNVKKRCFLKVDALHMQYIQWERHKNIINIKFLEQRLVKKKYGENLNAKQNMAV